MRIDGTTTLDHYLKPILEHRKLVVAVTAVTTLAAVAAFMMVPPSYRSTASLLLTPISGNPLTPLESDTDVDMATELLISTSKTVVGRVAEDLDAQSVDIDADELADNVSAASPRDSKVLDLTYRTTTPELAQTVANSFATNYLEYREQIAAENRADAVEVLNERIALLKDQLSRIEGQLSQLEAGTQAYVSLSIERDSVDGELRAQQDAVAALSTLSLSAGEVLSPARLPAAPTGPGLLALMAGGLAGGLVMGVAAAMLLSAVQASRAPRNRRASDRIEHNRRQGDRLPNGGRRATDRPVDSAVERPTRVTAGRGQITDGDDADPDVDRPDVVVHTGTPPAPPRKQSDRRRENSADSIADEEHTDAPGTETPEPTPERDEAAGPESPEPTLDPEVAARFGPDVPPPPRNRAKLERDSSSSSTDVAVDRRSTGSPPPPPLPALNSSLEVESDFARIATEIGRHLASGPLACLAVGQNHRTQSVAAGFALVDSLNDLGTEVLIIDATLDEPVLADLLGLPAVPGLSELIVGKAPMDRATQRIDGFTGLYAVTTGRPTAAARSAFDSPKLRDVLREVKQRFPLTVIIGGDLVDAAVLSQADGELDGLVVATSAPPGEPADAALIEVLSALNAPAWVRIAIGDVADSTTAAATARTNA